MTNDMHKGGETALHSAAAAGHAEACIVLVEYGADQTMRDMVSTAFTMIREVMGRKASCERAEDTIISITQ
jgi:ankyrin repeat protein